MYIWYLNALCARKTALEQPNKIEHRKSIIKLTNEKYKFVLVFYTYLYLYCLAVSYFLCCCCCLCFCCRCCCCHCCILNVAFTNIKWYMEYGNLMTMYPYIQAGNECMKKAHKTEPSPRTHAQYGNCRPLSLSVCVSLFACLDCICGCVSGIHISTDGGNKTYFG